MSIEETIDMTMIGTLVWGGRKTGTGIAGCTRDRTGRQVMDRIIETGGRCCLVADSRIGCSRQKAAPGGVPFGDRWTAARHAPVLDFRVDRPSSGRHGESGFGNGKGDGGRSPTGDSLPLDVPNLSHQKNLSMDLYAIRGLSDPQRSDLMR